MKPKSKHLFNGQDNNLMLWYEHVLVSSSPESVPIIHVPLEKPSRKGKEKIVSASVSEAAPENRKLDDLDEVIFVSETKHRKRGSFVVPSRMTRSHTGFISHAPASASNPKSSKKSKSKSYRPILLSPDLMDDWKIHSKRELILEKVN
ncbi:PREDICTED: uncharacterized protein LOC109191347 [Ipomoea nil]|uniref:uncharacterized protein LOC109191347 n=1 Tax=Ipomoea nil TaxID=35883 RepID=UPI000900FE02|nr:PREDICTED: uncharacterized protein LOC109191347 [Ipomoea nil]